MKMSKRKILVASTVLIVSCVLIILGLFCLSEAHDLWTTYKRLSAYGSMPQLVYESWRRQMINARVRYCRGFPIYLTAGLAFFASGVAGLLLTVHMKLVNRTRAIQKRV